jgi:hypothetical protein
MGEPYTRPDLPLPPPEVIEQAKQRIDEMTAEMKSKAYGYIWFNGGIITGMAVITVAMCIHGQIIEHGYHFAILFMALLTAFFSLGIASAWQQPNKCSRALEVLQTAKPKIMRLTFYIDEGGIQTGAFYLDQPNAPKTALHAITVGVLASRALTSLERPAFTYVTVYPLSSLANIDGALVTVYALPSDDNPVVILSKDLVIVGTRGFS